MNGRTDRIELPELAEVGKRIWSHWRAGRREVARELLLARDGWARCALVGAAQDFIRAREGAGEALRFVTWVGLGCQSESEARYARVVSGTGNAAEQRELDKLVEGLRTTAKL